ncbi:Hypothetical predicted protein [Podarcis lilfordi]|uniref:Uncharacterized protein n=1 Tax=Podarcis lilfordi TaxID=74358 RepID=A0AA35PH34_9SAUR|nr:Hypothetical predicted protein [Podarcis lilfordi]
MNELSGAEARRLHFHRSVRGCLTGHCSPATSADSGFQQELASSLGERPEQKGERLRVQGGSFPPTYTLFWPNPWRDVTTFSGRRPRCSKR